MPLAHLNFDRINAAALAALPALVARWYRESGI